ncbi:flagellar basal body P-ring formation chaperone FlgA [Thermithiobacillus plumbiphilus]|uniref:Flagella basal body P-ring formation protein FlgA n=1 Tax=Thermithiobacillus plumbiphilus TaxID=1729899 RepID=A0ABU9DAP2_9PROT
MTSFLSLFALGLLLMSSSSAWSAPQQDLQVIGKQVEGFVRQGLQAQAGRPVIRVGPIDKRLQLSQCRDLEIHNFGPANRAARTIQVRCQAPAAWTLYVPVSVKLMTAVVVASRPLAQGHTLTAGDLRLSEQDLGSLPAGVLSDIKMALGQKLASNIPAGFALRQDLLRTAPVIRQGQSLAMVVEGNGMRLVAEGEALQDGRPGQWINARNSKSGRIVKGIVEQDGQLRIPF